MNKRPKVFISYLIIAILHLQVYTLIPGNSTVLLAGDQSDCSEKLDQAEEYYYDGEFEQTIKIVNLCLQDQSLPLDLQVRSYTILARTYLATGDTSLTKDNIRIILKLDPSYQPTIEQETPRFVNLVEEVRKEVKQVAMTNESSGINKWLVIGAGGLAAAAIIAVVVSGSGNGDDQNGNKTSLPEPPNFPE
jgi:hypothetical protein